MRGDFGCSPGVDGSVCHEALPEKAEALNPKAILKPVPTAGLRYRHPALDRI